MNTMLQDLIVEEIGVESEAVHLEANLVDDLGMDSLDVLEMAMAIEEEFDVQITDEQVDGWRTVADLQACIGDESE